MARTDMNQNIYDAPKSKPANGPVKVNLRQKILCTLFAIFAAFLYRGIFVVAPRFTETFTAFGSDLPWLTRIAIYISPGFLVAAIISLLPCFIWLSGFVSEKISLLIYKISKWMFAVALLIFFLNLVAMYLPIFTL